MKQYKLPAGQYGSISGYLPQKLTDGLLGKLRTGLFACSPAEAVLLVQEIDRLNFASRACLAETNRLKEEQES